MARCLDQIKQESFSAIWASGSSHTNSCFAVNAINRALWLFGLVQIISILGFSVLANVGEGLWLLGLVISFEYLGVGRGGVRGRAWAVPTHILSPI